MVVVIILISLQDCISLASNLLWKRLQCSRLVLIQASHLLNLFPLSFTVSHVFIHDSLCGFWADAVLHHYKQIIAMLRLNKVSKSNGMVVFLFLFLRGWLSRTRRMGSWVVIVWIVEVLMRWSCLQPAQAWLPCVCCQDLRILVNNRKCLSHR